jgi:hypothetical protein
MNKTELLADLAARPYIDEVGTPKNVQQTVPEGEPDEGDPIPNWDGSMLYHVPIRQLSGIAGGLGLVEFYVIDDGGPGELAYYKDSPPAQRARPSAIKEWIIAAIDGDPNSYKGFSILWASERYDMVVFATLEGTPLLAKYWYVRKGQGAKTQITGTAAEITLYINALRGSLLQV